jgi:hypothetical protein
VTPLAGPMSYVRCTVSISRGKTDATGSSTAESHAHRAEGSGGRHSPRGPRAAARRELPADPGNIVLADEAACTQRYGQIQRFKR